MSIVSFCRMAVNILFLKARREDQGSYGWSIWEPVVTAYLEATVYTRVTDRSSN